jgi:hypothetical protein
MELLLIYPIGELTSVNVGILKMSIIKMLSSHELKVTGELPYKILSELCTGTTPEQFKKVSIVDSNRILFTAWKQTHCASEYIAKVACECGATNLVRHQIKTDYTKPDIYDRVHQIECVDMEKPGSTKVYEIRLAQPMLKTQVSGVLSTLFEEERDDDALLDEFIWAHIKSIDGKTDFDRESVPIPLYRKATELTVDDGKKLDAMISVTVPCVKCKNDVTSTLSWYDAQFLQG